MKLLKIEGVEKEFIVIDCMNCPLVDSDAICSIDNKQRDMCDIDMTTCPLPEFVDENEHTAPDGTELVAELSVSMDCVGCHYDVNDKCTCEEEKHFCIPSERRDKRFVRYVKKSEVK